MAPERTVVRQSRVEIERLVGVGVAAVVPFLPYVFVADRSHGLGLEPVRVVGRPAVGGQRVVGRVDALHVHLVGVALPVDQSLNGQALGDEVEFLVELQRHVDRAVIVLRLVVEHAGVGVGIEFVALERRITEAQVRIARHRRVEHRELHRIGREHIVEQRRGALRGTAFRTHLRVEVQVDRRRGGELVGDVVLEVVVVVADVVVEVVVARRVHDTRIVVEVEAHVVGRPVAAARDVDVGALVHVEVAEQHVLPVHVGVYVRCGVVAGHLYVLRRVFGILGSAGEHALVVELHPGGSVDEFRETHRLYERVLDRHADLGAGVFLALLRGDDHHAVGAAHAVDGRRGGVLEDGEALDRLGGDSVQVARRDLDVVQ